MSEEGVCLEDEKECLGIAKGPDCKIEVDGATSFFIGMVKYSIGL
jgi:hypothetical protein